jgi:hypothetical protein
MLAIDPLTIGQVRWALDGLRYWYTVTVHPSSATYVETAFVMVCPFQLYGWILTDTAGNGNHFLDS